MPAFTYTALSASGQQVTGKLAVGSRAEAFRKLEAQSLTPVKVVEDSSAGPTAKDKRLAQATGGSLEPARLKRAQIILFTEEMSDLLDGGLQIDQALRVLEERQESPSIKRVSAILRNEVREGATISKALKKASPSFDELYINMVAAGEASGSLPEILRRLAAGLTVMQELQSKVTGAMVYPAFLSVACLGMIVVFLTYVVPQITSLLSASGSQLPMATEMLIKTSEFFMKWWWLMLTAVIAIWTSFRGFIKTPKGAMWWAQTKMQLPLFGPVIASRFYSQIAHSLGNLVANGVPLLNSLKLTCKATANVFLQSRLTQAVLMVSEGASLSSSMKKVGDFPTAMTDLIAIGEKTGALDRSLQKAAARYDKELDRRIQRLTALISPIIMIIMAAVVGVVAYSIVTAVFSTSQGVRNQA